MKHKLYNKLFVRCLILVSALFSYSLIAYAEVSVRAYPESNLIEVSDEFIVNIEVSSSETINTIYGNIVYDPDVVELKKILDGNSVINFWIDKPSLVEEGQISFSGITPGGFNGKSLSLFSLVFKAQKDTGVLISPRDIKALEHSDNALELMVITSGAGISISKDLNDGYMAVSTYDSEIPEDFTPIIQKQENLFEGKNYIVFATQDKGTGVKSYKIKEGNWSWFKTVSSPYVLKDQKLSSDIYIKAIAYSNNERVVFIQAQNKKSSTVYGILLILVLCSIYVASRFIRKK